MGALKSAAADHYSTSRGSIVTILLRMALSLRSTPNDPASIHRIMLPALVQLLHDSDGLMFCLDDRFNIAGPIVTAAADGLNLPSIHMGQIGYVDPSLGHEMLEPVNAESRHISVDSGDRHALEVSRIINDFARRGWAQEPIYDTTRLRSIVRLPGGPLAWSVLSLTRKKDSLHGFTVSDSCFVSQFHGAIAQCFLHSASEPAMPEIALPAYLERVFQHLLKGDSEKQIARQLRLSRHSVHKYVGMIYERLKVHSRSELMAMWIGK